MRGLAAASILAALAVGTAAEDRPGRPSVEAIVPVPPTEHQRLHYFGRRDRHVVPGTVTINRPGYACDLDGKAFRDEDDFVAHVRAVHHTPPGRIADQIVVRDGRVHFIGE